MYLTSRATGFTKFLMAEVSRSQKDALDHKRVIEVGPCRMRFLPEKEHNAAEPPGPHESPCLKPLRDSSNLVSKKDSRQGNARIQSGYSRFTPEYTLYKYNTRPHDTPYLNQFQLR